MLDKTFNPQDVERRISALWETSGAFKCGSRPGAEPFSTAAIALSASG